MSCWRKYSIRLPLNLAVPSQRIKRRRKGRLCLRATISEYKPR
jgi:hypothetical protein